MICNQTNKPTLFHKYIRRKKNGKPQIGPIKSEKRVISDIREMSEVFVRSFSSVFPPVLPQVLNPHEERETEMSQIHSAPGSDGVSPKLLKSCDVTLSYPLLLIYIKLLREGKLPLA